MHAEITATERMIQTVILLGLQFPLAIVSCKVQIKIETQKQSKREGVY
jgi:hypothetical protein